MERWEEDNKKRRKDGKMERWEEDNKKRRRELNRKEREEIIFIMCFRSYAFALFVFIKNVMMRIRTIYNP